MPPRRRVTAPEPLDIDRVRADLAAGKAVRVAVASSAQFPDGASGRVRGLGDPDVVGPEFIEVEVSVNGVKDVLPFAPADLAPPAPRRRPDGEPPAGPVPGRTPVRRAAADPAAPALRPLPATASAVPSRPDPIDRPHAVAPGDPAGPVPDDPAGRVGAPEAATTARPAAPRRSAPAIRPGKAITVTVATTEAEPTAWRVEARIGSRVVLKPTPVSPARAWDLVRALDNEPLSAAVGAAVEQHRQATQARARALAAELQALQAELAMLPAAGDPSAGNRPSGHSA